MRYIFCVLHAALFKGYMQLASNTVADNINSPPTPIKLDFAVHKRKQCEIIADSNSTTGMEPRPNLPNKNVSCSNRLASEFLDSPPLTVGIPTITA